MSNAQSGAAKLSVRAQARAARAAARKLALLSNDERNAVLFAVAKTHGRKRGADSRANIEDCRAAEKTGARRKMSAAAFARLRVSERVFAR